MHGEHDAYKTVKDSMAHNRLMSPEISFLCCPFTEEGDYLRGAQVHLTNPCSPAEMITPSTDSAAHFLGSHPSSAT